ncbi:MAG: hypothetical protein ABSC02_15140 [Acidobacteriota bacterium]
MAVCPSYPSRERVELFLRRALVTQTFEYTLDGFPTNPSFAYSTSFIDLPRPPLQSIGA